MKCRGGVLFDAKHLAHLDCKATHETGISVVDEDLRKSHAFGHMFQVKLGNSLGSYCFVTQDEDYCFRTVVVCDGEYQVIAIGQW